MAASCINIRLNTGVGVRFATSLEASHRQAATSGRLWIAWRVALCLMGEMVASGPGSATARHGITPGLQALTGVERLLWEASERALRQPQDRLALVLHLSRLTPPAPRSYHIRIARVLMQDSAARFDGQVFAMRNQDLVLLCRNGGASSDRSGAAPVNAASARRAGHDDFAASPDLLPTMLGQLFSADVGFAKLTSLWHLDRDAAALSHYLAERAAGPALAERPDEQRDAVLSVAALQTIAAKTPLSELLVQQTGMLLDRNRGRSVAERLVPAFREFEVSLAALNLGQVVSSATTDPFLFRHLASGLDVRIVALLCEDLAGEGRLTRASLGTMMPLHINLGLNTILSPGFARLSQQAAYRGVRLGASVSLMQACAEFDLMDHARHVLAAAGIDFILTQIDPVALGMVRPARLRPDLVKIVWSPTLLGSSSIELENQHDALLKVVNPSKIVLQNVDSQQALSWGQAHGISLFQGSFLDQVQAVTRMAQCHGAPGCTMRQCGARASSVGSTGRAGCSNLALLDAGHAREEAALCS